PPESCSTRRSDALRAPCTRRRSSLHERTRLTPLPLLEEELDALVDHQLAVVRERDLDPLEWPRRRTLEVDAALVEAAAVARTLELGLGEQPARRAAEVRATGEAA